MLFEVLYTAVYFTSVQFACVCDSESCALYSVVYCCTQLNLGSVLTIVTVKRLAVCKVLYSSVLLHL